MPYAEIGASLQKWPFWSIAMRGWLFLFFVVVCFWVWLYSKFCEKVIIDENQLSHNYNILCTKLQLTKTTYVLINNEKACYFGILSHHNIKLNMIGDQACMCNLQPWVTIFSRLYLILCSVLCRYMVALYISCIMYK